MEGPAAKIARISTGSQTAGCWQFLETADGGLPRNHPVSKDELMTTPNPIFMSNILPRLPQETAMGYARQTLPFQTALYHQHPWAALSVHLNTEGAMRNFREFVTFANKKQLKKLDFTTPYHLCENPLPCPTIKTVTHLTIIIDRTLTKTGDIHLNSTLTSAYRQFPNVKYFTLQVMHSGMPGTKYATVQWGNITTIRVLSPWQLESFSLFAGHAKVEDKLLQCVLARSKYTLQKLHLQFATVMNFKLTNLCELANLRDFGQIDVQSTEPQSAYRRAREAHSNLQAMEGLRKITVGYGNVSDEDRMGLPEIPSTVTEVTLYAGLPNTRSCDYTTPQRVKGVRYPNVRRLTILFVADLEKLQFIELIEQMKAHFPSITHLNFTDLLSQDRPEKIHLNDSDIYEIGRFDHLNTFELTNATNATGRFLDSMYFEELEAVRFVNCSSVNTRIIKKIKAKHGYKMGVSAMVDHKMWQMMLKNSIEVVMSKFV